MTRVQLQRALVVVSLAVKNEEPMDRPHQFCIDVARGAGARISDVAEVLKALEPLLETKTNDTIDAGTN